MSFLSILKKIDIVVNDIEKVIEVPFETLVPASIPLFSLFDRLQQSIVAAEGAFRAPQSGVAKGLAVTQDFNGSLGILQASLATQGKALYYDPVLFEKARNDQVTAYNSMAELQKSFAIVSF